MDQIRLPDQAVLRQPRETHHDQQGQSELTTFRCRPQNHFRERGQHEYRRLLYEKQLLAMFRLEMSKPTCTVSLPLFHVQPTQRTPSTSSFALNPGGTHDDVGNRIRSTPDYQEQIRSMNTEDVRKSSGIRLRERRSDTFVPPKAQHKRRKKELLAILEPTLCDSDSSSILLCWGKENRCHIIPVSIPNSADDVTIWQEIRRAWYANRGVLRGRLPLLRTKEVEVVKISIAGREPEGTHRSKRAGGFVGTYARENLPARRGRLEQIIADYRPQNSPCPYNISTGQTDCWHSCVSHFDDVVCPEQAVREAERDLSYLQMRPFFGLAFSNSSIASGNALLDNEGIINSHQDVLPKIGCWHCPKLGELKFRGLFISEQWGPDLEHVTMPLAATVLFLTVIGAKFVYGDWSLAWNVGSFFVALDVDRRIDSGAKGRRTLTKHSGLKMVQDVIERVWGEDEIEDYVGQNL